MAGPQRFVVHQGETSVIAETLPDGRVRVEGSDEPFAVTPIGAGRYLVTDGTNRWRVWVAGSDDTRYVFADGVAATLAVEPDVELSERRKRRTHTGTTTAPMPGTVIAILVEVGSSVRAGDVLLTLEAMKMELPLRAPRDGTVSAIHCRAGELVQPGVTLVDLT
jgi:biotin carboxyl carrier protein